ncbi:MAG: hypothetical protein OEV43_01975 [Coriobacteriia bacterium]|nr:hypothetical protein [Coriobacteriia bacterium]
MRLPAIVVVAFCVTLVFGMTACQRAEEKVAEEVAEKAMEDATGSDVELDENKVTITGEDGESVEISGSEAELAEGFPSDVPVYEDGTIESSGKIAAGGVENYTVSVVTNDSVNDVFEWYKSEFDDKGWNMTSEFSAGTSEGDSAMLSFEKSGRIATLAISQEPGGETMIACTVASE